MRDNPSRIVIDEAINQIAADNTSGAAEILRRAGAIFTLLNDWASEPGADNFDLAQRAVIETCAALASAQFDMIPLLRLANVALSAARTATDARGSLRLARAAAMNFIANAERAAHNTALHSAALIPEDATLLTHSRSSTVLAAFVEAKHAGRSFSVVATESRPMLEGRALAESVSSLDIPVTLIADAAASLAMDQVDLVIVGADTVTPTDLVNKIGTQMIALAARNRDLPLYALCDSSKFIREDYFGAGIYHRGAAEELWPDAPRGVTVVNRYFEPTPLSCFTGIVTEDGALSIAEAARRAEQTSIDSELVKALRVLQGEIK